MFQLEISDPAEAEALLSQNLMCNVTGIVYKVEEFRQMVTRLKTVNPNKSASYVVRIIHTKDALKKK